MSMQRHSTHEHIFNMIKYYVSPKTAVEGDGYKMYTFVSSLAGNIFIFLVLLLTLFVHIARNIFKYSFSSIPKVFFY